MGRPSFPALAGLSLLAGAASCALIADLDFVDEPGAGGQGTGGSPAGTPSGGGQGGTATGAAAGGGGGLPVVEPDLLLSLDGNLDDEVVGVLTASGDELVLLGRYLDDVAYLADDVTLPPLSEGLYVARLPTEPGPQAPPIWEIHGVTKDLGLAGLAADSNNILVGGKCTEIVEVDEISSSIVGSNELFQFGVSLAGIPISPLATEDPGPEVMLDVAVAGGSAFLLGGSFEQGLDLGSGFSLTTDDAADGFVARRTPIGTTSWLTGFLGAGSQIVRGVTKHLDAHVVVGSSEADLTIVDSKGLAADHLLIKDSVDGAPKAFWARLADGDGAGNAGAIFGGSGAQHAWDVASAGNEGFVVAGFFHETLTVAPLEPIATSPGRDGFITLVNPSSGGQWVSTVVGANTQELRVVITKDDLVVAGGVYTEGGEITNPVGAPLPLPASVGDTQDIFVAGFDRSTGEPLWAVTLGGAGDDDFVNDLAIDSQDRVVVVGRFAGALTMGTTTTEDTGGNGLGGFVARFTPPPPTR